MKRCMTLTGPCASADSYALHLSYASENPNAGHDSRGSGAEKWHKCRTVPSRRQFCVAVDYSRCAVGPCAFFESMQDRGRRSGRRCGEPVVVVRGPEAMMTTAEGSLERVVQHGGAHVQEGLQ